MRLAEGVDFREAVTATERHSFADLKAVCRHAVMQCVRAELRVRPKTKVDMKRVVITPECLKKALREVRPSPGEDVDAFQAWSELHSAL